jgi:hypothetical protein
LPSVTWTYHAVEHLWRRSRKRLAPDDVEPYIADAIGGDGEHVGERREVVGDGLRFVLVWQEERWTRAMTWIVLTVTRVGKRRSL